MPVFQRSLVLVLGLLFLSLSLGAESWFAQHLDIVLSDGWKIQSSEQLRQPGTIISLPSYDDRAWHRAVVPTTVLAALVADKVYADPLFGNNIRLLPGVAYPPGAEFSNIAMPEHSPFASPWWYRVEFTLPKLLSGTRIHVQFEGVNFRANVWVNGRLVADATRVAGTFRSYEFDITESVSRGEVNALAVEVFPPTPHDLQLNWVDVNPAPPDKDMGLWRPVRIVTSGPIALRHPNVISTLQMPAMADATLKPTAELSNMTDQPVDGVVRCTTAGVVVNQTAHLEAYESKTLIFDPHSFPHLALHNPRLWWPVRMGAQNLYRARFDVYVKKRLSDTQTTSFGIRTVTSELTPQGNRLFRVNGRRVLIRGAGWWGPDMLLRSSPEREDIEIGYALNLGLNALRMDGKFGDPHLLDLADKAGLMLLPGFACCDHWEHWDSWNAEDKVISAASLHDVLLSLRTHPSVIAWLEGDDNPPPPEYERLYREILEQTGWPATTLSSATDRSTPVSGETGVKMSGPYMWEPPIYWYTPGKFTTGTTGLPVSLGGYGFNTETTSTVSIPPIESVMRMLSQEHLNTVDASWDFHGAGGEFLGKDVRSFVGELHARYGPTSDTQDLVSKAQLMSYEAERAMFEAFGRNKYEATGVLHEMLNSAWPSFVWNLYDFFLRPGGAYFGVKKACEPVHIQYSYDNRSLVIVNSLYKKVAGLHASAEIYDLALRKRYEFKNSVDVAPDSTTSVTILPEVSGLTSTYFVHALLTNAKGDLLSTNLYWLSTKPDTLDWDATTWMDTPPKSYANYSLLNSLPKARIHAQARVHPDAEGQAMKVTISNPSRQLAFFLQLKAIDTESGEESLPVLWDDNYVTLMPGESRTISARLRSGKRGGSGLGLVVSGFNVEPTFVSATH